MQLLSEISQNLDMETVARNHNRTIGGITVRLREIACDMYVNNMPMDEIINKTRLPENQILEELKRKGGRFTAKPVNTIENQMLSQSNIKKEVQKNETIEIKLVNDNNVEHDIAEIKEQLKIMNKNIEKILGVMGMAYAKPLHY